MVEALHRQVLALASLAAHQAEQIARLTTRLAAEDAATIEMAAVVGAGLDGASGPDG